MCWVCATRRWTRRLLILGSVLVTLLFLAAVAVNYCRGAPAPLGRAKAPRPAPPPAHPRGLCGDWTFWWGGQPYHYRFHADGTFSHHGDRAKARARLAGAPAPELFYYRGTWALEGRDAIRLVEWPVSSPETKAVYELKTVDGWRWRCTRNPENWVERGWPW
jgi:hypothetical protein